MKSAKRWTLAAILAAGNIYVSDDVGDASGAGDDVEPDSKSAEEDDAGSEDSDAGEDPEVLKRKLKNKMEEQDRQYKLWQADKKRADDLQKKQDEADRKGKTELENAKADVEARDKQIEALTETIRRLAIENAFVALSEVTWHNPQTALKLVDLSDVEFDKETGKPKDRKQLVAAAKTLAKENPFLVRSKTDAPDDTPDGKPSGKPPNGKPPKGLDADALRRKYNINT